MPSPHKTTLLASVIQAVMRSNRKTRLITFSALFLTICAFGAAGVAPIAPDAADIPVKQIIEQLQLPSLEAQIQALEKREGSHEKFIHEEKIQRGDTLASLLQRLGVDDEAATRFIKSDSTARLVMQQKAGKTVRAQTNEDGELQWLQTTIAENRHPVPQVKNITIARQDVQQNPSNTFSITETNTTLERRIEMRTGDIVSSLFAATDAIQVPDAIASQLVELFSTNIDFSYDLRRGDHFQLMYETFWQNGEMVNTGKILAAEFNNAGRLYQSVWFDEGSEKTGSGGSGGGYYGFDGKSLKKAFLKSPIAFTRISSGFAMRMHPISGRWKQHSGVDFAAPAGTPIRASADGVVDVAKASGGYGNLIVLKHWSGYSTAYGHMSRFAAGMRKGTKVKQGDVIGYVGSTGWATGPHLHYEFRVNNKAQDPLKVKMEQMQSLTASDMRRFKFVVQDVQHRFALLRPDNNAVQVAAR